jgi:hypothetical protein
MAQADASGITQGARKLANTVEGWINKIPTPSKKKDTSWNDEMVRKANESFRKAEEKKAQRKKPVAGPANKAAVAKKKTAQKDTPKKRVAGK